MKDRDQWKARIERQWGCRIEGEVHERNPFPEAKMLRGLSIKENGLGADATYTYIHNQIHTHALNNVGNCAYVYLQLPAFW